MSTTVDDGKERSRSFSAIDVFDAVATGIAAVQAREAESDPSKQRPPTPWERLLLAGEFHDGGRVVQWAVGVLVTRVDYAHRTTRHIVKSNTREARRQAEWVQFFKGYSWYPDLVPEVGTPSDGRDFCLRVPLTHKTVAALLSLPWSGKRGFDEWGSMYWYCLGMRKILSGPDWDAWLVYGYIRYQCLWSVMLMDTSEGFRILFDFERLDKSDAICYKDITEGLPTINANDHRLIAESPHFKERCDDLLNHFERIIDLKMLDPTNLRTVCGYCNRSRVMHRGDPTCHAYQSQISKNDAKFDVWSPFAAVIFPELAQMQRYVNLLTKLDPERWKQHTKNWKRDLQSENDEEYRSRVATTWRFCIGPDAVNPDGMKRLKLLPSCVPPEFRDAYDQIVQRIHAYTTRTSPNPRPASPASSV